LWESLGNLCIFSRPSCTFASVRLKRPSRPEGSRPSTRSHSFDCQLDCQLDCQCEPCGSNALVIVVVPGAPVVERCVL